MKFNLLNNLRIKSYLFFNGLKYDFRVRKHGKKLHIIVPERFKKYVKSIKIIITLIGLLSSFIAFNSVIISFLFGLVLFLIVWILEKFIFTYTALYIAPFPNFKLESEKWIGNAFGVMITKDRGIEIPSIGLVFSDINYAKKIHNLILSWSYGEYDDKENNVTLSAIVENSSYQFFIYPSITRTTITKFLSKFEKRVKEIDPAGEPNFLFTCQILMKHCEITNKSYFPTFRNRYRQGIPYIFQIYHGTDITNPIAIEDLRHFRFYNLKIKNKNELTRQDPEYDLIRIFK